MVQAVGLSGRIRSRPSLADTPIVPGVPDSTLLALIDGTVADHSLPDEPTTTIRWRYVRAVSAQIAGRILRAMQDEVAARRAIGICPVDREAALTAELLEIVEDLRSRRRRDAEAGLAWGPGYADALRLRRLEELLGLEVTWEDLG